MKGISSKSWCRFNFQPITVEKRLYLIISQIPRYFVYIWDTILLIWGVRIIDLYVLLEDTGTLPYLSHALIDV